MGKGELAERLDLSFFLSFFHRAIVLLDVFWKKREWIFECKQS